MADGRAAERLLLCEHEPVITLGRNATRASIVGTDAALSARGVAVHRVGRGGDVTYHGPGQLMVYPVVHIGRSIVGFLERIAGALAAVCAEVGVPGARWRRDPAGLWLGEAKLAACGLAVRRGVVTHGFALDVATPPEAWALIVPCGLADARVISLQAARGAPVPAPEALAPAVAQRICDALGRRAVRWSGEATP